MGFPYAMRAVNAMLAGKVPDEATLRSARAELDAVGREPPVQHPDPPVDDEAVRSLAKVFLCTEQLLVQLCKRHGKGIMIDDDLANAMIEAKRLLTARGWELVAFRSREPITLTPPAPAGTKR